MNNNQEYIYGSRLKYTYTFCSLVETQTSTCEESKNGISSLQLCWIYPLTIGLVTFF